MEAVAAEVNAHAAAAGQPPKSVDEVAMGFVRVANETMCRPIRALTQMKARAGSCGCGSCSVPVAMLAVMQYCLHLASLEGTA